MINLCEDQTLHHILKDNFLEREGSRYSNKVEELTMKILINILQLKKGLTLEEIMQNLQ